MIQIHPLFRYIAIFLVLGGIGMYVANRRVDAASARQRWLKFFTYIAIVNSVIASLFLDRFYLCAILISALGLAELITVLAASSPRSFRGIALGIYLVIASSFIYFSLLFRPYFLLFIYFQVITFDGFCQVIGQLLGHHPLLPHISPSKTVEGLIGGALFCAIAAGLARDWVGVSLPTALLLSIIISLLSFIGDSLASYLKRRCQVKDYGTLLPGHGGFLDRFDSLMMVGTGYSLLAQIYPLQ